MIPCRLRIIVRDAGCDPGTSASEVWCTSNEPPHLHLFVANINLVICRCWGVIKHNSPIEFFLTVHQLNVLCAVKLKIVFLKMHRSLRWCLLNYNFKYVIVAGLGIRSEQMSKYERFTQVAQDKWATVSESLRSLMTNERMWAIHSGCSEQMSEWANRWGFLSKSLIFSFAHQI